MFRVAFSAFRLHVRLLWHPPLDACRVAISVCARSPFSTAAASDLFDALASFLSGLSLGGMVGAEDALRLAPRLQLFTHAVSVRRARGGKRFQPGTNPGPFEGRETVSARTQPEIWLCFAAGILPVFHRVTIPYGQVVERRPDQDTL